MAIKVIYETLDEVPEQYRDLYTEKNGKYELTGVEGIQTSANVQRLEAAARKEREEHKKTKDKLAALTAVAGDKTPEDLQAALDKLEELEAIGEKGPDEERVNRLVETRVRAKTAPLERENKKLKDDLAERDTKITNFEAEGRRRRVHDAVREAGAKAKIVPAAVDDMLILSERVFDVLEGGAVVTKDGVGCTPGLDPVAWLSELQPKRPHWWPNSVGTGANGSGPGGGGGSNPWSKDGWNLTEQGNFIKAHGPDKAAAMAKAAGSKVGATRPPEK